MIAHLVLFTLKPGIAMDDPRVMHAISAMHALPKQIPAIRGWEHGRNTTADTLAADYALHALFDDEAALHGYFEHPAHVPVLEAWEAVATLAFADFER